MSNPHPRWPRRTGRRRPPPASGDPGSIPVAALSIYDPIHFGIDENGRHVDVRLMYRNLLAGGEPGSGKSSLLNTIIGHTALCCDAELWLFDGKEVEFEPWRELATVFVGCDLTAAIGRLRCLQEEINLRIAMLKAVKRRKILATDPLNVIMCVLDEFAYYTATAGYQHQREEFERLLRDIVARGRAVGVIVVAATQRPSASIVDPSLRDLFAYRVAFRVSSDSSSEIILAPGWVKEGYSAKNIAPEHLGVGYLLAEGGTPRRFKAAYLHDAHIAALVSVARITRRHPGPAA